MLFTNRDMAVEDGVFCEETRDRASLEHSAFFEPRLGFAGAIERIVRFEFA